MSDQIRASHILINHADAPYRKYPYMVMDGLARMVHGNEHNDRTLGLRASPNVHNVHKHHGSETHAARFGHASTGNAVAELGRA